MPSGPVPGGTLAQPEVSEDSEPLGSAKASLLGEKVVTRESRRSDTDSQTQLVPRLKAMFKPKKSKTGSRTQDPSTESTSSRLGRFFR